MKPKFRAYREDGTVDTVRTTLTGAKLQLGGEQSRAIWGFRPSRYRCQWQTRWTPEYWHRAVTTATVDPSIELTTTL